MSETEILWLHIAYTSLKKNIMLGTIPGVRQGEKQEKCGIICTMQASW